MNLCKHSSALCGHDPECPDMTCEGKPLSFPLHRQVMPTEHDSEGYTLGYWLAYGVALAVFLAFVFMTWVVYPNFPQ